MPRNAIENVAVDHILPAAEIAKLLVRLARERTVPEKRAVSEPLERETRIAEGETQPPLGVPSVFRCPECDGVLFEIPDQGMVRFRCHLGHAFGAESLVTEHNVAVEGAFWAALRALQEQGALHRRLAKRARALNQEKTSQRFAAVAATADQQAEIVRKVLLSLGPPKKN